MPSLFRHPKSGIFYAIHRVNKKQVWRTLKTRNRLVAHSEFAKVVQNSDPRRKTLLSNQIKEFIDHVSSTRGVKTCKIYEHALRRFLVITGDIPVSDVNERHFDKFVSETVKTISNVSANVQIRALKAFFNCLKRWKVLSASPLEGAKQLRVEEKMPAYFSEEELHQYLNTIKNDSWLYEIVIFAVLTGTRLGEIVNLQWKDVDLANKRIFIQSSLSYQTKSGKARAIPISENLWRCLSTKSDRQGYVFRGRRNGGRAYLAFVSRQFKKSIRMGGFSEELHFHSLRHTFASLLVKGGISLYQVQKLLGHSNIQVTQMYAHLEPSNLHNAVNILDFGSS